jgi:hypothetical protein
MQTIEQAIELVLSRVAEAERRFGSDNYVTRKCFERALHWEELAKSDRRKAIQEIRAYGLPVYY